MDENLPTKNEKKILVVDDEKMVLDVLKNILEKWEYEVETSLGATAALEIFKESPHNFGLVITDWVMPCMNGGELIQKIREIQDGTRLKIIVMSGYPKNEKEFAETKIDGFLMKPFNFEKLKNTVREVLDAAVAAKEEV
ncbi:MAG: response regulator, partial [Patescibacteria group bacterium]